MRIELVQPDRGRPILSLTLPRKDLMSLLAALDLPDSMRTEIKARVGDLTVLIQSEYDYRSLVEDE